MNTGAKETRSVWYSYILDKYDIIVASNSCKETLSHNKHVVKSIYNSEVDNTRGEGIVIGLYW